MPSIIPSATSGGIKIRDNNGNLIASQNVYSAYNPNQNYRISCSLNYLPSDCNARITPEQINAFQSELIAFAEKIAPKTGWNCDQLNNLAISFGEWVENNLPNLTIYMEKSIYDPKNLGKDVFSMENMIETDTAKIMKADEREKLNKISGLTQDYWNAGTSSTEALISPAKLISRYGGAPKSGWVKLPNGLITQFGSVASGDVNITYPIAFPNNCFYVAGNFKRSDYYNNNTALNSVVVSSFTKSGCRLSGRFSSAGGAVGITDEAMTYFAIGY